MMVITSPLPRSREEFSKQWDARRDARAALDRIGIIAESIEEVDGLVQAWCRCSTLRSDPREANPVLRARRRNWASIPGMCSASCWAWVPRSSIR